MTKLNNPTVKLSEFNDGGTYSALGKALYFGKATMQVKPVKYEDGEVFSLEVSCAVAKNLTCDYIGDTMLTPYTTTESIVVGYFDTYTKALQYGISIVNEVG